MCQDELRMISSDLCKAWQNPSHLLNNKNAQQHTSFCPFFLGTRLILRHSTCGEEAVREAKQEEDGLTITAGLSLQFFCFQ